MTISSITPAELSARITRGERVDLIDVRTTREWNAGHAVGARHVPLDHLDPADVLAKRSGLPDEPIYVISASDGRSATACEAFHRAGFMHMVNVEGGTRAWEGAGLPMKRHFQPPALGLVKQVAILAVVGAVVLFLMPCSPISLWGSAYCPIGLSTRPAHPANPGGPDTPTSGYDFHRDVIVASASVPVLVDFHADWCPPCTLLDPEIAALEQERGDRLRVVRIDVDQHGPIAQAQGVSGIPDVRLWRNGKEVGRFVGFRKRTDIAAWIDQATATR